MFRIIYTGSFETQVMIILLEKSMKKITYMKMELELSLIKESCNKLILLWYIRLDPYLMVYDEDVHSSKGV